jgi:opacity protein-like surface antigen
MKKYLAALTMVLLGAGAAQAEMFDNPTVSVLGGWSSHPNLTLGASQPSVSDSYNVGARIGVDTPIPGFTMDADYFYNRGGYASGGSLNSQSVMGDLIYHTPPTFPVRLYGGAGLGLVNDSLGGSLTGSSTVMGWQALGGAEFPMENGTTLFAEYRYQNAHNANAGAIAGIGNTSNNLSVGVKFPL